MKIKVFNNNEMDINTYLVIDDNGIYIIDPGLSFKELNPYLKENNLVPTKMFLTHGHIDHIMDTKLYSDEYKDLLIYIYSDELSFLFDNSLNLSNYFRFKYEPVDRNRVYPLNDNDMIDDFKVIHTPGHTRGSIALEYHNNLFTGDTLFKDSIGRTDFPSSSYKKMNDSLMLLYKKYNNKNIKVYPGHYIHTTMKEEIENNPYLSNLR